MGSGLVGKTCRNGKLASVAANPMPTDLAQPTGFAATIRKGRITPINLWHIRVQPNARHPHFKTGQMKRPWPTAPAGRAKGNS